MAQKHAPDPQILNNLLKQLMDLTERLPFVKRPPAERRADGHLLFANAAQFTGEVRFVLEARPALYADLPEDADAITRSQELADSYRELHLLLKTLSRLCEHSYLYYQADAVRRAKTDLDYILHGVRGVRFARNKAADFHRRRAGLLYPAFLILHEVRSRLPHGPARTPKAQKASNPAEAPPPLKKPPPKKARPPIAARLFAAFVDSLGRGR